MRTRIRPKRPNAPQRMWPQVSKPGKASHRKTGKIRRAMKARERGRVLVASGRMPYTGEKHAVLARFAGGGDEESWVEFLRTLAGEPEWVVSDRDQAIINAVARVWPNATHYFCEQHLAHNAGEAAAKDAKGEGRREALAAVDSLLEAAQYSPAHWAAAKREARAQGFPHLVEWMDDNEAVVLNQMMKRRQNGNYWRSAGATEEIIRRIKAALYDRRFVIRNVDRLNITLGLIRADADKQSSETAYSRILREFVRDREGRLDADWRHLHDRRGTSSIDELIHEAELRQQRLRRGRQGRGRSRLYHAKRAAFRAEAEARGVVMGHGPRRHEVPKSVAGTRISDYGWLVAQWHPTRNGTLRPEDVEAGSGTEVWWLCPGATDHEWPAQVRSRTLRGTGCPFCTHRRVAPSGSIAATHPEIAAQWHPTRNGEKCPEHFTFGSHFEAWWQCPAYRTHVWLARVSTRTVMATGCPSCARLAGKGGANKGKKREEPPDEGQGGVSLAS